MFRVRAYLVQAYLVCFDLAVIGACYAAVWGAFARAETNVSSEALLSVRHVETLTVALALWLAFSFYFGMYHSRRLDQPFSDLIIIAKVSIASLIGLECFAHLAPAMGLPHMFVLRFLAVSFITMTMARLIMRLTTRELRRRGHNVKALVLITSPEIGRRVAAKIDAHAHYGYRVLCHFLYFGQGQDEDASLVGAVRGYLRDTPVDDVIIALPSQANGLAARLILECENQGVNVRVVPDLFPLIQTDTQVHNLDGIPLVNVRHYPAENFEYAVLKRLFDVSVSLAALVLLSPVILLIALLIRLTSAGSNGETACTCADEAARLCASDSGR